MGFFKLNSKVLDELWSDPIALRAYLFLAKRSSHLERDAGHNYDNIKLAPYQVIVGSMEAAVEVYQTEDVIKKDADRVYNVIKKLERLGFIKREPYKRRFTIITLLGMQDEPKSDLASEEDYYTVPEPEPLKQSEKETESVPDKPKNAFKVFEENWGMMPPLMIEDVGHEIDEIDQAGGDGDGLVIAAIKVAVSAQAPWRFAKGVLLKWRNANVLTVDQARAFTRKHENEVQQSKQQKPQYNGYGKKPGRKEKVPEWFNQPDEDEQMTPEQINELEQYRRERAQKQGGG